MKRRPIRETAERARPAKTRRGEGPGEGRAEGERHRRGQVAGDGPQQLPGQVEQQGVVPFRHQAGQDVYQAQGPRAQAVVLGEEGQSPALGPFGPGVALPLQALQEAPAVGLGALLQSDGCHVRLH